MAVNLYNEENAFTCICDSYNPENRLNSFSVRLAKEYNFQQDYSIGVQSISLPNVIFNIRQDSLITFLYCSTANDLLGGGGKSAGSNDDGKILYRTSAEEAPSDVIFAFNIKVKKGAYITHQQLIDGIKKGFREADYAQTLPNLFKYREISSIADKDLFDAHKGTTDLIKEKIQAAYLTPDQDGLGPPIFTYSQIIDGGPNVIASIFDFEKNPLLSKLMTGSEGTSFVWTDKSAFPSLSVPKHTFNWTRYRGDLSTEIKARYNLDRQRYIEQFTGVNVLHNLLVHYLKDIWPRFIWLTKSSQIPYDEFSSEAVS